MSVFRNMLMTAEELPYKKLRCIIATGTQYIITDYTPNYTTRIEMRMNKPSWNEQWDTMFGSKNRFSFMQYGWNAGDTKMQVEMFGTSQTTGIDIEFNKTVDVVLDASLPLFQYDGNTYTPTRGSTSPDSPLYIFAKTVNNSSAIDHRSNYKLYHFRIYENGTLVRNYIPVLDENNIPCLYDTVNDNYFYNAGTGTFSYEEGVEPDPTPEPLPSGVTELKSIIVNGTQRIDTGIIPNDNNYGFEAKFNLDGSYDTGSASTGLWDWNILNMGGVTVDDNRFGFGGWLNRNTQPAGLRASYYLSGPAVTYGQDYTVLFNYNHSRACSLNGNEIVNGLANGSYVYSDTWSIFCQTYNDGSTQYGRFFYGKLYYLKIWLGTTLVRDYIPVLDSNGVPCLYDKVNETFNYNSGTGTLGYETLQ